jgi:hypothetical protein
VALITASATVLVGLSGLIGNLAKNDPASTTAIPPQVSQSSACVDIVHHYVDIIHADPTLLKVLTSPATNGKEPIEIDPDAKRCWIDATVLRQSTGG